APAHARAALRRQAPLDAHHTGTPDSASSTGTAGSVLILVARAAPSATPAHGSHRPGRRRARHSSHTAVSRNPAAGTSSVASEPCAITSGEKQYSASAVSPPAVPASSRAKRNTTAA